MPTVQDDRTPEERRTHTVLVVAEDRFLSGWGGAQGGKSIAAWACAPDVNSDRVYNWVKARPEMRYVRIVLDTPSRPYRPHTFAHFHVSAVTPGHPALA